MGTKASILNTKKSQGEPKKDVNKNIRGDLAKKYESQTQRQTKMMDMQRKLAKKAEQYSERMLEEKDRLSIHTRSLTTSQTTSRTTSPNISKKHVHFQENIVNYCDNDKDKKEDINTTNVIKDNLQTINEKKEFIGIPVESKDS
ncbi:hypothetical protein LOTGIDRAFT_231170 [Lottia gigantea]|uniref:Uncharacterized protein n=1 Tax=Lottia gigantea TaxID=225164 RepID=V4A4E0_LOTGI|nr:hypothetical protein LOTGIDRAFT_231170 [Lottia gigantea]ESO98788.1 hypothetical protein LOTGIDRAFT_231170 [Lottia gigantea]